MGGRGLEPPASAMSTQCSNQLSYPPEAFELYTYNLKLASKNSGQKSNPPGEKYREYGWIGWRSHPIQPYSRMGNEREILSIDVCGAGYEVRKLSHVRIAGEQAR